MTQGSAPVILGHGIDLVDVARIKGLLERHGERFERRIYTEDELAYCNAQVKRRPEHLAARFAAKEAILKALGTGLSGGISWTELEVVRLPSGQPVVLLHGRAAEIAGARGITGWHISLSHTESSAAASAIAVGPASADPAVR